MLNSVPELQEKDEHVEGGQQSHRKKIINAWFQSMYKCNTYLVLCACFFVCICSHLVTLKAEACWPEDDALMALGRERG